MESFEQKKTELDIFREEIAEMKKIEMEKKEQQEKYNPHFNEIEPNTLIEEDLDIYKKCSTGSLKKEEFLKYQSQFREIKDNKDPRFNFMAWLGNKLNTLEWYKRWNPEFYKDKEW